MTAKCKHEWQYYVTGMKTKHQADCGFRCISCQYVPEYEEQMKLAETELGIKIFGLAEDLYELGLIYIPNGSTGGYINHNVYVACQKAKRYDENFICQKLFADPNIDLKSNQEK